MSSCGGCLKVAVSVVRSHRPEGGVPGMAFEIGGGSPDLGP
jgi:hypothetical protein